MRSRKVNTNLLVKATSTGMVPTMIRDKAPRQDNAIVMEALLVTSIVMAGPPRVAVSMVPTMIRVMAPRQDNAVVMDPVQVASIVMVVPPRVAVGVVAVDAIEALLA